ncbi:olfactomedin-like protein 2A isoform X4 [Heterodontus francisci]|uniref:olfactomedin-like protein 2A isoform X4 n=1 Tax=Heterodontus francisci TaxID=7792 RepID=UPI00355B1B22
MRAGLMVLTLLLHSILITSAQNKALSRRRREEEADCKCAFKMPTPEETRWRGGKALAEGFRPKEMASTGSKCKCYCGFDPCEDKSERGAERTKIQDSDLMTIQGLAADLQEIFDNTETKRLNSYSAKLNSQLKKLEKVIVELNPSKPSPQRGNTSKNVGPKYWVSPQPPVTQKTTIKLHTSTAHPAVSVSKAVTGKPSDDNGNMIREDSCAGTPVIIWDPVTHSNYGRGEGVWMKDLIVNQEKVYVANYFFGTTLIEFRNLDHLKLGRWGNTYKLPYSWMGTGHAVYNGSFYYNKAYTRTIIRYDLRQRTAASWASLDDLVAGSAPLFGWKGYSEVDFTVDEGGLWVTYFSNDFGYLPEEVLVLSRLDPIDLTFRKETTWKTQVRRPSYSNYFLICGVFYALDLKKQKEGIITYAFDTHTGFESNPGLMINSRYSYLTQIDYNPTDKLLYAWDNGFQVTYDVIFSY